MAFVMIGGRFGAGEGALPPGMMSAGGDIGLMNGEFWRDEVDGYGLGTAWNGLTER
jgi:hypothetical protein